MKAKYVLGFFQVLFMFAALCGMVEFLGGIPRDDGLMMLGFLRLFVGCCGAGLFTLAVYCVEKTS